MAKKITYTRGDGKGGTVTKTGWASNKTAASLSARSKSSGGSKSKSSSTGLSQAQVDMLRNMPGIDQKALGAYVSSGSVRADSIGKAAPVVIPDKPVQNVGDMLGMNNASVLTPGLTLQGGQFVPDPNASEITNATKEANMNLGNVATSILGYLKPEENQMANAFQDTYGISERQAQKDLARAEAAKSKYTAQLNNITASRDAEMLKLEGQGRGQTQGFIGGEQARINREAAIQALPVQAQLAAAQGDYETAKAHVDQLFQMKIADIQTEMQYKTTVANTLMSVASTQQQNMLQAAIADANARAAEKSQNLQLANQWAQTAIQTGQSTLASKMMALDTKSPTFMQDLASLQGQISIPKAPVKRDTSFDKFGNLIDMQTGEVIRPASAGGVNAGIEMPDGSFATPDELAYAQQYASTGQIPTGLSSAGVDFGRVAELAREMKKPDGAIVDRNTGVAPSNISGAQKDAIVAMSEIVQKTLPRMQQLWDEAQRTNFGGTGVVGGIASKVAPSDAMSNYLQARDEFLSKLLVARSGAAVTEQEYERYSNLVPGAMNNSFFMGTNGDVKLQGLQKLMTTDLNNKLNSNQLTIYGYSTVDLGGESFKVGELIVNEYGQQGLVQPDGSITLVQ